MISVLYTIILITNFKLIEMCIKSSPMGEGQGGRAFPPPPSGREGVGLLIFSLSPTSLGPVYLPY